MLRKDLYQPVYIFFGAALYLYLLGIATFCGSLSLDTLSYLVTKVLSSGSDTRFGVVPLNITQLSFCLISIF